MNYRIAIASHKRPERLKKETLSLLERAGISKDIIDIYIDFDEEKDYVKVLPNYGLHLHNTKGLKDIRTMISKKYKQGDYVVFMDDDIKNIIHFEDKKKYNKNDNNLKDLIKIGFENCEKENCGLWGCCPFDNPFFGNQEVSTKLKFIIQAVCGAIINHEAEERSYSTIEDYERTIKYFLKDGKVVRVNNYGLDTKIYADGGLNEYRNFENKEQDIKDLCSKYPDMVKITYKKKKGEIIKHPQSVNVRFNYNFKKKQ
jgi:hypothetical protein